jgi:hypothetical protein
VNEVFQQQPDLEAPEKQQEAYDPWEAVEVAWDGKSGGYAGASHNSALLHGINLYLLSCWGQNQ